MRRLPPLPRLVLAGCLVWAWMGSVQVWMGASMPRRVGLASVVWLQALSEPTMALAVTALALLCAMMWLLHFAEDTAAGVLLILFVIADALERSTADLGLAALDQHLAPAVLLGWMLARRVWAAKPDSERAFRSHELAVGVVAGASVLAGLSALTTPGQGWLDGEGLMLVTYVQAASPSALTPLRAAVAASPALCQALAWACLAAHLAGGLYVIPRMRRPLALLALVVSAAAFLLWGLLRVDWTLLPVALAFGELGRSGTTRPGQAVVTAR